MRRIIVAALAALAICATAAQAQIVTVGEDISFVTAWAVPEGEIDWCDWTVNPEEHDTFDIYGSGYTANMVVPPPWGPLKLFTVRVWECLRVGGPVSYGPNATSAVHQFGPERDIDGDGVMGMSDKNMLFSRWQCAAADPCWDGVAIDADLNGDDFVGQVDLSLLKAAWQSEICHSHWRYLYGPPCEATPAPEVLPANAACMFGYEDDPAYIPNCTPPSVPVLEE